MKLRAPAKLRLRRQKKSQLQLKVASRRSNTADAEEEDRYQEDESNTMKLSHAFFVVLVLHLVLIGGIFGFNYIKARQIPSLLRSHPAPTAVKPAAGVSKEIADSSAESPIIPGESPATAAANEKLQTQAVSEKPSGKFRTHRVAQGETLQRIAVAYGVTVAQIENANNVSQISDGQLLRIPPRTGVNSIASSMPLQTTSTASEVRKLTTLPTTQTSVAPSSAGSGTAASPQKSARDPATKHKEKASREPKSAPSTDRGVHGAKGAAQKEGNQIIYTVAPGDNPYAIARRFKIHCVKLLQFNHIKDPTKLQIGTKLKIPPKNGP